MIEFQQVNKRYSDNVDALQDVNFTLESGEMAFLTGHSGAGKSTLLKLIARIETASSGNIFVDGICMKEVREHHIPYIRRSMGIVFQNPQLLYDRTVYDNIAMPLIIAGFPEQTIPRRVSAALDKVGLLQRIPNAGSIA